MKSSQTPIFSNYWMRLSRMWRILQIKEDVIHRGRRRWLTPSEICRILHILRKPNSIIAFSYSFKKFLSFWLVKTTCITHHNQLLFTKFGKNLRHIETMTSKVEPSENYWPLTSKWRQKCSLLQIIEPLTTKTWGQGCVIFGERKNRAKWRNSFKNE